jgi:hypothetical protein
MPPYSPAILVSLLSQPVVAEDLSIKVVCLIRGVVDVELGTLVEKEGMVVDLIFSSV